MQEKSPSTLRIIQIDYLSSISVIFPIVAWGLVVVARFLDPNAVSFFIRFAPVITVLGLIVLIWRLQDIRSLFMKGNEVPGVITKIGFFRGRGRVTYVYTYQGKKYESSNAIQATKFTKSLSQGQNVTIMVDPDKPKHAFIRELYAQK